MDGSGQSRELSVRQYPGSLAGDRVSDAVLEGKLEPNRGENFSDKVKARVSFQRSFFELGEYPSEKCGWIMQRVAMGFGLPMIAAVLSPVAYLGAISAIVFTLASSGYTLIHILAILPKRETITEPLPNGRQRKTETLNYPPTATNATIGLVIYLLSLGYVVGAFPGTFESIYQPSHHEHRQ